MSTNAQVFGNNLTAAGARLRRSPGGNQYPRSTSLRRFVERALYEFSPGRVRCAPVDDLVPVGLHTLNVQVFKGDQSKTVDQLATFLVSEVAAAIGRALIGVKQRLDRLAAGVPACAEGGRCLWRLASSSAGV